MILREVPWWRTAMGEREAQEAAAAISASHVTMGPVVPQLEQSFADALEVPYVVATPSGSAALVLSMMALGVGPGDEVIVPNRTFVATAHAALLLGARVVLADIRTDLPLLDVDRLADKISPHTKAILAVHLNGRAVEMDRVRALAEASGIHVIEDACQALFSRNAAGYLGTQSEIGCYSLGITKLISSGFGGLAVTRDRSLFDRMKLLRNQGLEDTLTCEYQYPGFNFKCSDVLASIGLVQLARRAEKIAHVHAVYRRYVEGLQGSQEAVILPVDTEQGELPLYAQVMCPRRAELMQFLHGRGIQTRKGPPDLSAAHYLARIPTKRPTRFAEQNLILPCGPDQPLENVDYVIDAIWRWEKQRSAPAYAPPGEASAAELLAAAPTETPS